MSVPTTLRRVPVADPDFDGQTRYRHRNGQSIKREKRDWTTRGMTRGAAHQAAPLYYWTVYTGAAASTKRAVHYADTLAEAAAWCDEHPRSAA